jgi:hypothetical protein
VFRLVVALLLALTVGWKIALSLTNNPIDHHDFKTVLVEFLERQHYAVIGANDSIDGGPTLKAAAGDCRILIAEMDAGGWNHDMVQDFATADDRVFFVFRGAIYTRPPTWSSVTDHYWSRFMREIGFKHPDSPIVGVIASTRCNAERLPWHEFMPSVNRSQ